MNSLKILLIEDDEEDYFLVADLLKEIREPGYHIDWVYNSKTIFNAIDNSIHDLYLIDYSLGFSNGLEILNYILAKHPFAPAIILTGLKNRERDMEAMQARAVDYLIKGEINASSLERSIRYAVSQKSTEKALAESQQQTQAILKAIPDMMLKTDMKGNITEYFLPENFTLPASSNGSNGQETKEILSTKIVAPNTNTFQQAISSNRPQTFEHHTNNQSQEQFYEGRVIPFGKKETLTIIRDTTEKKLVELETTHQAQDLRLINNLNQAANQGKSLNEIIALLYKESRKLFSGFGAVIYLLSADKTKITLQNTKYSDLISNKLENLLGLKIPEVELLLENNDFFNTFLYSKKHQLLTEKEDILQWIYELSNTIHISNNIRSLIKKIIPKILHVLQTKSMVTVPLISEDSTFGLLQISSKNILIQNDIKRIQRIANQVSSALKRVITQTNLEESEERNRILIEYAPVGLALVNKYGNFITHNPAILQLGNYTSEELMSLGNIGGLFCNTQDRQLILSKIKRQSHLVNHKIDTQRKDGSCYPILLTITPLMYLGEPCSQIMIEDLSKQKEVETKLHQQKETIKTIISHTPMFLFAVNHKGICTMLEGNGLEMINISPQDIIGKPILEIYKEDPKFIKNLKIASIGQTTRTVLIRNQIAFETVLTPAYNDKNFQTGIYGVAYDITEKLKVQQEQTHTQKILLTLNQVAQAIQLAKTEHEILQTAAEKISQLGYFTAVYTLTQDQSYLLRAFIFPGSQPNIETRKILEKSKDQYVSISSNPIIKQIIKHKQTVYLEHLYDFINEIFPQTSPTQLQELTQNFNLKNGIIAPLTKGNNNYGILVIGGTDLIYEDTPSISTFSKQIAASLENVYLFDESNYQIKQLQTLRTVDKAISSSLDIKNILKILVEQLTIQWGLDAADVLILNEVNELTLGYAEGYNSTNLKGVRVKLGSSIAGRVGLERKPIFMKNLHHTTLTPDLAKMVLIEKFKTYYGVPLIANKQLKGVLEIFHRSDIHISIEQENFLETLADQAAIAIEMVNLFDGLQKSNTEMLMAYDSTLNGWGQALALKDAETEEHTLRVTDITLQIARAMHISEDNLVHIRRGALLHDIGKMGIPDKILLKKGRLTNEERKIMEMHPVYAYNLLSETEFLHSALDIPYYHHEKWDGTGYPKQLKGEEIPISARIFAIADVWDALTSDRPYRKAWSREKTLQFIKGESGKHFDPKILEVFLAEFES